MVLVQFLNTGGTYENETAYVKYVCVDCTALRPFLTALTDLDFLHKFVIDNPETPPYAPMFTNFGLE